MKMEITYHPPRPGQYQAHMLIHEGSENVLALGVTGVGRTRKEAIEKCQALRDQILKSRKRRGLK